MESPPQYPGAPKKSKTGLILGLSALAVVVCCCGGCGLMLFFSKDVVKKGIGLVECSSAMSQQRDGLVAYASKHGGKLPSAVHWQDDIKPFVTPLDDAGKPGDFVHIPTPDEDVCDAGSGTSLSYNAAIAGKKLDGIEDQYGTVLLFETPGKGRNRSAAWKEPDFNTSPIMLKGERRGWIRQPIRGQAFYRDKLGRNRAASNVNTSFHVGDTPTKGGKDDSED